MPSRAEATPLRTDFLLSWAEAEQIGADWRRLSGGLPFRSWEWHDAWWRTYGRPHQLLVMRACEGEQTVGIAPLFVERVHGIGRVLRFLGSGEVCTDQQGFLIAAGYERAVGGAFADALVRRVECDSSHGPSSAGDAGDAIPEWDMLELNGLEGDAPAIEAFLTLLPACGFQCHRRSTVSTWRIPLPSTMDEYAASLSKPSRRKVRTSLKRLSSPGCRVEFAETESAFSSCWQTLVTLHQRRRNSLGEAGCFQSKAFGDFLFDAANAFRRNGRLDLACVYINDEPIAAELCFCGESVTFAYQLGIDPDSLRENPGWLVNTASIQRSIERGQAAFDLCRGDEEYKRHLGALPSPSLDCRVVPPKLRSQLWDAALVTQEFVKDWLKAGLTLSGIR